MTAETIVEAACVSKRFGSRLAVDRLDLRIPSGVCFGLLGPNGAGKTTTLRMIYGVTRPSSGEILVFGMDIARNPRAVRSRLGVTLQQNVLIEALSPEENLRVFGRYHLLSEPELSRRIGEVIDFLELKSHAKVPVQKLSGGFQRRLAIALSLMNRPELLILDEPTHRTRSRGTAGPVVARARLEGGRHDHTAHHSLYGRGPAPLRPGRHHLRGKGHG